MVSLSSPYHARPASHRDIDRIWQLLSTVNIAESGTPGWGLSDMENWLTSDNIAIDEDVLVVEAGDGAIVGAEIIDCRAPYVRPYAIGGVDPAHTNHGLGHAMLTWARQRIEAGLDRAPAEAAVTMVVFTAADHEHSARTMENFGLRHTRYFLDLKLEWEEPIATPVPPEGVAIRSLDQSSEMEALARLFDEGFRDHYGFVASPLEERVKSLQHWATMPDHQPDLWVVAESDGDLVGYIISDPANEGDDSVGYVGSLAVRPDYRGRGLGRALLLDTFHRMRSLGKRGAALGVDADSLTGATRLYESVGMEQYNRYSLWEMTVRDGEELATIELGGDQESAAT